MVSIHIAVQDLCCKASCFLMFANYEGGKEVKGLPRTRPLPTFQSQALTVPSSPICVSTIAPLRVNHSGVLLELSLQWVRDGDGIFKVAIPIYPDGRPAS